MTIHNALPIRYTEPIGNPAPLVGIFIIDKLLTNVVQDLSAVILEPMMWVSVLPVILLLTPPNIDELFDDPLIILSLPPPINDDHDEVALQQPPPITE